MVYASVDFVFGVTDICELFIKSFCFVHVQMAVLVSKLMLLLCCVGGFLLNSFAIVPTGSQIVFVINFIKVLFLDVCFVFMYVFM